MKYIRFISKCNEQWLGVLTEEGSIELLDGDIPGNVKPNGVNCSLDDIKQYLPPIAPVNIIAIGMNYLDHAKELDTGEVPDKPLIFIKSTNSLNAHNCCVTLPIEAPEFVDFEAELAIVIGKLAKHVAVEDASDYIFGYTCANDLTARDCQNIYDNQWARSKSFDTFCPLGPVIETDLDTSNLRIRSILNGQTMQDGNTKDMIFPVAELVSYISRSMTLLPGTVIITGTPGGIGYARDPKIMLCDNDIIQIEIQCIGVLDNHIVKEVL